MVVTLCSIALQLVIVSQTLANSKVIFKDVLPTNGAYDDIMYVVENQYMTGISATTFRPNMEVTRAEAVLAIARSLKKDKPTTFVPNFKDIKKTDTYYHAVAQLTAIGVIQNTKLFQPNEPLKRMQLAKMLALAYAIEVDDVNNQLFKDVPSTHWAFAYIGSLADTGIIKGVDGKYFAPNRNVSRAQMASFVKRSTDFQVAMTTFQVAYDFLGKTYIKTVNDSSDWAIEVVNLVNVERKKQQLPALIQDDHLVQIAVIKAQDMMNRQYFEHESPFYGQSWDLATLFDYSFTSFGENIAKNYYSPKDVVAAWMASPNHKKNIMHPTYTNIGVGIKKNTNGYYWVQLFSSK